MDELELVRRFRAEIDVPDRRAEEWARRRLEDKIDSSDDDRRRRAPRRVIATLAGAAGLAALLAAPGLGLGDRLADAFGLSGGHRVEPRRLSQEDRWLLRRGGAFGFRSMRLLGSRGPIAYYAIGREDRSTCFATGLLRNRPHISSLDCPTSDRAFSFPSRTTPLLDRSTFSVGGGASRWIFVLTGIAANGVYRVGVKDARGVIHSTRVHDNVYYTTHLPEGPLRAIVALDGSGRVIHSLPLGTGGAGAETRAEGEAGSVLVRFMAARINRDDETFVALMTPDLRHAVEAAELDVPTWQVSNPCWYRYEILPPEATTGATVTERVRIFEHWWPGDVGGSPPKSFEQQVRLRKVGDEWLVDALGPAVDERVEEHEPHGPNTSACNLAQN